MNASAYVAKKYRQNNCPLSIESIKKITVAIKKTTIITRRVTNAIKKINNALALNAGNLIPKKPH
ncbi:MAG: hypothetical protein JRE20_02040 [Deltaproteobacteria bacterium]|nr:hypothetical protein [Deltaproteobacteria bacterium]